MSDPALVALIYLSDFIGSAIDEHFVSAPKRRPALRLPPPYIMSERHLNTFIHSDGSKLPNFIWCIIHSLLCSSSLRNRFLEDEMSIVYEVFTKRVDLRHGSEGRGLGTRP